MLIGGHLRGQMNVETKWVEGTILGKKLSMLHLQSQLVDASTGEMNVETEQEEGNISGNNFPLFA